MKTAINLQVIKDISLIEVVGKYMPLQKRGANYCGHCPFHNERTPSFFVNAERNRFKCFGCTAEGDAVDFVMRIEKKNFHEAVSIIADIFGLSTCSYPEGTNRVVIGTIERESQPSSYDTIPMHLLDDFVSTVGGNSLIRQFLSLFSVEIINHMAGLYKIKVDRSRITFPQIDILGELRTGKCICYDERGHRVKSTPQWIHNELKLMGKLPASFIHKQCLTGEHLLSVFPDKPVGIVEGQSTMLFLCALGIAAEWYNIKGLEFFARHIWLCTGGVDAISWKDEQVIGPLKGRNVILFPDAGFLDHWSKSAEILNKRGVVAQVSTLLENKYMEGLVQRNDDLRDYFLTFQDYIKGQCLRQPPHIWTKNIISPIRYLLPGVDFDDIMIVGITTKDGSHYDLLFDADENLIQPGDHIRSINKFSSSFERRLHPIYLDDTLCLGYSY